MTAPGHPPAPVRETLREGRSRGPAAHDRVPRLPRLRPAPPAAGPPARHRRGLPGAAAARGARAVAGRGARGHRPAHVGPHPARRGRHHRRRASGLERRPSATASTTSPRCGTSRPSTTSPSRRRIARRVNVDGTDQRARRSAASTPGTCSGCSYVSTCYVSGRYDGEFTEDALDEGQDVPQPLRVDEVRGRAAGAQGDGRRPARHDLPPGHRRRRLARPARPRSTTAPTSSPRSCAASRPSRSSRPSATPTASGSAWCRATSSSTRWTSCRCWTSRSGRTYALDRPRPADGPRGRRRPSPRHRGKRVVWVPLPLRPAHALVDARARHGAAARPARRGPRLLRLPHDVLHRATRRATSPAPAWPARRFASYADRLLDFMRRTPRSTPRRWSEQHDPGRNAVTAKRKTRPSRPCWSSTSA